MSKTTKKILFRFVIAPLVLALLLYLIYNQIIRSGSIEEQWTKLKVHYEQSNPWIFLLVLALAPINWLTEALKWRISLAKIFPVSVIHAYKAVLTGISFAFVSPGKVGDFAGRILHVPNEVKVKATVATLINNIIQALATSSFGLLGLVYINIYYPQSWAQWSLIGFVVAGALLSLLIIKRHALVHTFSRYNWFRKLNEQWSLLQTITTREFLKIYGISCLRFLIYNIQFLLLMLTLGAPIGITEGLFLTFLMFWLIAVIPSFMVADLGVRGFIAGLVFINTHIVDNTLVVLSASYIIWLLNQVLPAILGSILVLFIKQNKKDE